MKLRYYLRGLGIGMVVTALIMGVALKGNQSLSDAEIRVRAMELGMVDGDSRTLADVQASQESGISPEPSSAPENVPASAATDSPSSAESPAAIPSSEAAEADPLKPLPMVTPKPPSADSAVTLPLPEASDLSADEGQESITFVIQPGQNSYGVSKDLKEAGLVEDASGFDQYLIDNDYSRRIKSGTYEIPFNSTQEEIAKIITRSR